MCMSDECVDVLAASFFCMLVQISPRTLSGSLLSVLAAMMDELDDWSFDRQAAEADAEFLEDCNAFDEPWEPSGPPLDEPSDVIIPMEPVMPDAKVLVVSTAESLSPSLQKRRRLWTKSPSTAWVPSTGDSTAAPSKEEVTSTWGGEWWSNMSDDKFEQLPSRGRYWLLYTAFGSGLPPRSMFRRE